MAGEARLAERSLSFQLVFEPRLRGVRDRQGEAVRCEVVCDRQEDVTDRGGVLPGEGRDRGIHPSSNAAQRMSPLTRSS